MSFDRQQHVVESIAKPFSWPGRLEALGAYLLCCIGSWLFAGAPLLVGLVLSALAGNTADQFTGMWLLPSSMITGAVLFVPLWSQHRRIQSTGH